MANIKQIIDDFYSDEEHQEMNEMQSVKISVKAQIPDATMLSSIAKRFNTTRSDLVSGILHDAVLEMYFQLSDEDRAALSIESDKESTELLEKQGVIVETHLGKGSANWREYDAMVLHRKNESKGGTE